MTDRELLELAAKACGELMPSWYGNSDYMDGVLSRWNPLTDDGDALRLAVKLGICVDHTNDSGEEFRSAWAITYLDAYEERYMDNNGDIYAATRRAIVRAAASIGEQMK